MRLKRNGVTVNLGATYSWLHEDGLLDLTMRFTTRVSSASATIPLAMLGTSSWMPMLRVSVKTTVDADTMKPVTTCLNALKVIVHLEGVKDFHREKLYRGRVNGVNLDSFFSVGQTQHQMRETIVEILKEARPETEALLNYAEWFMNAEYSADSPERRYLEKYLKTNA